MKKTFFVSIIMAAAVLAASSMTYAQATPTAAELDKNMELMRKDLRSGAKQLIALNLPLTDVEATKFWPVYDQYVGEMGKQYDQLYALIKDYAAVYNAKTVTDAQAIALLKRSTDIQAGMVQVRQKYVPIVEKVLPGKKAAMFFQIDRRLYMLLDLQIASEVPIVVQ